MSRFHEKKVVRMAADWDRGGAGAGPDWDGQSCVHVHMTNVNVMILSLVGIC